MVSLTYSFFIVKYIDQFITTGSDLVKDETPIDTMDEVSVDVCATRCAYDKYAQICAFHIFNFFDIAGHANRSTTVHDRAEPMLNVY